MPTFEKNCEWCGKMFSTKTTTAKFCPECRIAARSERQREYSQKNREKLNELRRMARSRRKEQERERKESTPGKKPASHSVEEIAKAAREAHMSYGEYVARMREE